MGLLIKLYFSWVRKHILGAQRTQRKRISQTSTPVNWLKLQQLQPDASETTLLAGQDRHSVTPQSSKTEPPTPVKPSPVSPLRTTKRISQESPPRRTALRHPGVWSRMFCGLSTQQAAGETNLVISFPADSDGKRAFPPQSPFCQVGQVKDKRHTEKKRNNV